MGRWDTVQDVVWRASVFAAGDVGFGERAYPIEDPSGNMMVLGELRGVGVE